MVNPFAQTKADMGVWNSCSPAYSAKKWAGSENEAKSCGTDHELPSGTDSGPEMLMGCEKASIRVIRELKKNTFCMVACKVMTTELLSW